MLTKLLQTMPIRHTKAPMFPLSIETKANLNPTNKHDFFQGWVTQEETRREPVVDM